VCVVLVREQSGCSAAQMRVERARQLLDAGADRPGSNEALQLEIMIRETTKVMMHPGPKPFA